MIRTSSAIAFGAFLISVCASGAGAADLYGSYAGSVKDRYVPRPVERAASSIYLRVDGGYGAHDDPVMVEDGVYDLINEEMDGAWSLGGGVGYYFTPSIRGDVTVERRFETDAQGALADNRTGIAGLRSFGVESTLVMFNMYYDIDNRSRFTPYIGAGLGYVHHETKDGTVQLSGGGTGTIAGTSTDDVAGSLMAGVSVALLDRVKLDVGYRFLYMGATTTGPLVVTPTGQQQPVRANDPTLEDLHAHEIKFGLRYDWH
ncbi:MAG: outer membrane beta-barrel protein [Alphaproteobacteria bacterium]|nr:outer membrane beta-barrel protein [Alphaproteobacteria bacterium]